MPSQANPDAERAAASRICSRLRTSPRILAQVLIALPFLDIRAGKGQCLRPEIDSGR
jgi:hypothetical protein